MGEKGVGGAEELGKEGIGNEVVGSGRNTRKLHKLCNISQSKKAQKGGSQQKRIGTRIRGYGKLDDWILCSPHTTHTHTHPHWRGSRNA